MESRTNFAVNFCTEIFRRFYEAPIPQNAGANSASLGERSILPRGYVQNLVWDEVKIINCVVLQKTIRYVNLNGYMATNINVEVKKNANESTSSLIRRFTKRVQGSGILPRVREITFRERPLSRLKRKRGTLKSIIRRKEIEHQKKLGKLPMESSRR